MGISCVVEVRVATSKWSTCGAGGFDFRVVFLDQLGLILPSELIYFLDPIAWETIASMRNER